MRKIDGADPRTSASCSFRPGITLIPVMTEILILIVLAAIIKLMLVTVFAGVRYRRRRDMSATPVSTDTSTVIGSW